MNLPLINILLYAGGTYDGQSANEYCFTLSNTVINISSVDAKYVAMHGCMCVSIQLMLSIQIVTL